MTDIDVYQPAAIGQYQAGIVMDEKQAKALDDQVRLCTEAVLREGTDYGIIPGTGGDKTLWRPGAQKLLQWFRLECTCERIDIERDDDGRKHGITYRAEVGRGLKTATPVILATCEGTADYDESKFFQSAEEVAQRLEAKERKFAKIDGRVANPTKWKGDPTRDIPPPGEYRADWNALMKRAQKRAIVGAVNDATAAGGIFTDREEDDHAPVQQDDGPSWYEQALERAADVTGPEDGNALYVEAAEAHKKGWCNRRQQDTIQNILKKRARLLKKATPVDVEDLARASSEGAKEEAPAHDQPGSVSEAQLTKLHTVLTGLGFGGDDREQKLVIAEVITGRAPLTGPADGRSSKNLSLNEARKLIDTLDGFADRDALIAYMADRETGEAA